MNMNAGKICASGILSFSLAVAAFEAPAADAVLLPGPVPGVPMTGLANPDFKPVDDAIVRFMSERCVGAAVIGIAYRGVVLHNRGYGYQNGPPWAGCATAKDPFVGSYKIQPHTPFRIGSNSKAVTAAVFRIELKKALAAKRGVPVTDEDIEALTLLDNGELELVSSRVRAAMLAGGGLNAVTIQSCPVVNPWPKVTVGQLLTHRSGLPRSGEDVYEELSKIRSLDSVATLADQEAASGAPAGVSAALKAARGDDACFVPASTLEEYAIAQGNRCFASEPGAAYSYSNSGFGMLGYVLEHVTGKAFNAKNGYPFMHSWSLLSDFTEAELGFNTGIELSHAALGKRDPAEPRYREWNGSTYYPTESDEKRPWCVLSAGHCDFSAWASGATRYNWDWKEERVPFTYRSHSMIGGVGLLAAEAPKYLAFMDRFSVSTPYGKDRSAFEQTSDISHTGALDGTASWVAQLNRGSLSYKQFTDRPDGRMSFDLFKATNQDCSLPEGVAVFYAMNQTWDAKCTAENECIVCEDVACTRTTNAYGLYVHVLKEALCKATWNLPALGKYTK